MRGDLRSGLFIFIFFFSIGTLICTPSVYPAEYQRGLRAVVEVLGVESESEGSRIVILEDTGYGETGYGISFSARPTSLDFGSVEPDYGLVASDEVTLSCQSNNDNPWELYLQCFDPLSSGIYSMPIENIRWNTTTGDGSGSVTSEGALQTTQSTFYECSPSEWIMSHAISFNLSFTLDIPPNQAAGNYTTTVVVGMVDRYARDRELEYITLSIEILPKLTMEISKDTIEFGDLDPGDKTPTRTITVSCSANNNTPWSVSLEAASELSSGTYVIPSPNFRLKVEESGYGSSVGTNPVTVYRAASDEYVTQSPAQFDMSFYVDVPEAQPKGNYETVLIFTMTEDAERR